MAIAAKDADRPRFRHGPGLLRFGILAVVLAASALAPQHVAAVPPQAVGETFDVYRPGVYSIQATWTWCTAASVQIMRNILLDETSHSAAEQGKFFDFMRARNLFVVTGHRGVEPQAFAAGLREFVDPRYSLVASPTFDSAVRSAVTQLRVTGEPVGLIVAAGRHAWVLTGYTATADPAATSDFQVISVRIVGPLYGRQNVNGYDPRPDTSLTYDDFRRFLLPYRFPFGATPWSGRYLTIQAIPEPTPPNSTVRPLNATDISGWWVRGGGPVAI
jgi:hypothetical protein